MADDLANKWGTELVTIGAYAQRRAANNHSTTTSMMDNKTFFRIVQQDLQHIPGSFKPIKLCANGSEANFYAVFALTENATSLLIACGSYVAGDFGPIEGWSTSNFNVDDGPTSIMLPSKVQNSTARNQTIPMPYHIPTTMCDNSLMEYEDKCLMILHHRCLLQKAQGNPIGGVLLELMLASNGTTLSDRYLKHLGMLAKQHSFSIIVDEIMTGGRHGVMLLTETKPIEFVTHVSYITLGKWFKTGMVLANISRHEMLHAKLAGMQARGSSTDIVCDEASVYWNQVKTNLNKTTNRRKAVLCHLKISEAEAWGGGVHIFGPVRRSGTTPSTKNRFLPLLQDTPIDKTLQVSRKTEWSKSNVNNCIVAEVYAWINDEMTPYIRGRYDLIIKQVIHLYVQHQQWNDWWFSFDTLLTLINPSTVISPGELTCVLKIMMEFGLIKMGMKGKKRKRVYIGQPLMKFQPEIHVEGSKDTTSHVVNKVGHLSSKRTKHE